MNIRTFDLFNRQKVHRFVQRADGEKGAFVYTSAMEHPGVCNHVEVRAISHAVVRDRRSGREIAVNLGRV